MSTRTVFILAALVVLLIGLWFVFGSDIISGTPKSLTDDGVNKEEPIFTTLTLGETVILAETVSDPNGLKKGLGGRKSIKSDEGMLLSFTRDGEYGIWMKDMNFALDIVWLNSNYEVVYIEEGVSPDTFPKIFSSPAPSRHVLELNEGTVARTGISEGDRLK